MWYSSSRDQFYCFWIDRYFLTKNIARHSMASFYTVLGLSSALPDSRHVYPLCFQNNFQCVFTYASYLFSILASLKEKNRLSLRERRQQGKTFSFPLEVWRQKDTELGRQAGRHICICNRLWTVIEPCRSLVEPTDWSNNSLKHLTEVQSDLQKQAASREGQSRPRERTLEHDWAMKHITNSSATECPEKAAS